MSDERILTGPENVLINAVIEAHKAGIPVEGFAPPDPCMDALDELIYKHGDNPFPTEERVQMFDVARRQSAADRVALQNLPSAQERHDSTMDDLDRAIAKTALSNRPIGTIEGAERTHKHNVEVVARAVVKARQHDDALSRRRQDRIER